MCEVSPDFISLLQGDSPEMLVVVRLVCGDLVVVWPPCTVTRQCGSAPATTAYHHHHCHGITDIKCKHFRSVTGLTLSIFQLKLIKKLTNYTDIF